MPGALAIVPLADRVGARAAGEIGLWARAEWRDALERLTGQDDDVYLELSAVTFTDVAAASELAAAAGRLGAGRRIVVDRPPSSLRRALRIFWPDLTAIEVRG
ncbi:STAS domain-containing protein [Streptomyces specialis]|uniref:STAS domain-containing protein n=1 Tax=Streptomyces specialis TaxID=498367 RepID=UPI00073F64DD|nr:STAS domain-containing protein [Streptomyces specialis]